MYPSGSALRFAAEKPSRGVNIAVGPGFNMYLGFLGRRFLLTGNVNVFLKDCGHARTLIQRYKTFRIFLAHSVKKALGLYNFRRMRGGNYSSLSVLLLIAYSRVAPICA